MGNYTKVNMKSFMNTRLVCIALLALFLPLIHATSVKRMVSAMENTIAIREDHKAWMRKLCVDMGVKNEAVIEENCKAFANKYARRQHASVYERYIQLFRDEARAAKERK